MRHDLDRLWADDDSLYFQVDKAIYYYSRCGYNFMHVPWFVQAEAYYATKPKDARDMILADVFAPASGEQSFLQLILDGFEINKACCATPCYRYEPKFDDLHLPFFFKVELIDRDITKLEQVIDDALEFHRMDMSIGCVVEKLPDGSFDIIAPTQTYGNVELGSYGIRRYKDLSWVYGTGLTIPRSLVVRKAQREEQKK